MNYQSPGPIPDPFPEPEWPPIQNLEEVDLVGVRQDGGVDLVIVVSQPLDDSDEVLNSIVEKVETYLQVTELEEFLTEMGNPERDKIRIVIDCSFPIHPTAQGVIEKCRDFVVQTGLSFENKSR